MLDITGQTNVKLQQRNILNSKEYEYKWKIKSLIYLRKNTV